MVQLYWLLSINSLRIVVILEAFDYVVIDLARSKFSSSNESSIFDPVSLDDAASILGVAAFAAIFLFLEYQVSVAVDHQIVAWRRREWKYAAAVSIRSTVIATDQSKGSFAVVDVFHDASSGQITLKEVPTALLELALPILCPYFRLLISQS